MIKITGSNSNMSSSSHLKKKKKKKEFCNTSVHDDQRPDGFYKLWPVLFFFLH